MRTTIRAPFAELMTPQEASRGQQATNTHNNYGGGAFAVHNFANDHPELIN